jgi:carboxymethylenebutenolidase
MGQNIRLTAADGHELGAWLSEPAGAPRGAIVVAMEMYGVNDYLQNVCEKYAADGYVAIAPQFFDRFAPDVTFPYDGSAYDLAKVYSADSVPHIVNDAEAAKAHVNDAGRVAISGYCFGGTVTWLAACRSNFDAAIAYYGSNMCDYPDEAARCPIIAHVGDQDTAVPPADVAMFKERRPECIWHIYPGVLHGFDNSTRAERYNAEASKLARERTMEFLERYIG